MDNSNSGDPTSNRSKTSEDLSKKILGAMQSKFTGEETAHWIANVNEEPSAAITQAHSKPVHLSSMAFLDKLFDDFQRYSFELSNAEALEKYDIICNRPVAPTTAAGQSSGESLVIFQGTLITNPWALVMQAQAHKIVAFIVPVENLDTFSGRETFFTSYMEIDGTTEDSVIIWKVDGQTILDSMVSFLSKKLFGILLRVKSGTALPAEQFSLDINSKEALNLNDMLFHNRRSLNAGYESFVSIIDQEINQLSAIAMKGIQVLDKDNARDLMVRTNHLKMWREKLLTMGEELKQIIAE